MNVRLLKIILPALLLWQCGARESEKINPAPNKQTAAAPVPVSPPRPADTVLSAERKPVPILCYHHIKENTAGRSPDYTISTALFKAQIKMLHDSGFHAVLPEQVYEHLKTGAPLPPKPIMISFDDGHAEHFSIAAPELERYNFRGVFFIMGIVIGKPNYISSDEIKQLDARGHAIASHTWDHPDLRTVKEEGWDTQLKKTGSRLQQITGRPIEFLAYPNGAWNDEVVKEVKESGYKAAFQLTRKQSESEPLYTIRRILVTGTMSPAALYKRISN